jgi:hypothetical protein
MTPRVARHLAGLLAAAAAAAVALPPAAHAGILWYHACGDGQVNVVGWYLPSLGYSEGIQCPFNNALGSSGNHGIWLTSNGNAPGGFVAHWEADPPPSINLIAGQAPTYEYHSDAAYTGAFFYWQSGNSGYLTSTSLEQGQSGQFYTFPSSRYFGWELACNAQTECGNKAYLEVNTLTLEAEETAIPSIHPNGSTNIWNHGGNWARGSFTIQLEATDDSGVCQATVTWDGQRQADPSSPTPPNSDWWNQCDPGNAPSTPQYFFTGSTIDTTTAVPGSRANVPLVLTATNAAGNTSTYNGAISVDNVPVSLSLSGPASASVTSGAQYLTARATAGQSGVGSIMCSTDGSPWTAERLSGGGSQTATAQVPVSGLGQHSISCYAANQAMNAQGVPATSATQTSSMRIGEPVSAGIAFGRVIEHCRRVVRRVTLPGRWVTIRRHHKSVRVHRRGRTRDEHVLACHAIAPDRHVADFRFGHRVTISGWLAARGIALSHARVRILAAPEDGAYAWRTADVVETSSNGSWTATLRAGPSRLIEAVYDGGSTTLPASSQKVRALVPARIALDPIRTHVPWGGVLVIRGHVLGGHIPREQILQVLTGVGRHLQVIGNPFIRRDGRFTIKLAATGAGGPLRTQVAVGTLKETNYPYARGISRRIWVTLGA